LRNLWRTESRFFAYHPQAEESAWGPVHLIE
jgi:hypothetical protein